MANTYKQVNLQLVFAVRYRAAMINKIWKPDLHKCMTGMIQSRGHKMLQINSVPDHIHIFLGLNPEDSISKLVQFVKSESTKWINKLNLCRSEFRWQRGFGVFSYSQSAVPDVIRYIQNQEAHHKKTTFLEEYRMTLEKFEIEYDDRYIFKEPE